MKGLVRRLAAEASGGTAQRPLFSDWERGRWPVAKEGLRMRVASRARLGTGVAAGGGGGSSSWARLGISIFCLHQLMLQLNRIPQPLNQV